MMDDPRKIKLPQRAGQKPKARCNRCGRWIALVKPTKKFVHGSRLMNHKGSFEDRKCWGVPTFIAPLDIR